MPLGFSALHCVATVFCRASNYDMFLKDLSNPRVFTDTDCAIVLKNFLRCAVFSRALNYDTEKFVLSTFKKKFFVAVCGQVQNLIRYFSAAKPCILTTNFGPVESFWKKISFPSEKGPPHIMNT